MRRNFLVNLRVQWHCSWALADSSAHVSQTSGKQTQGNSASALALHYPSGALQFKQISVESGRSRMKPWCGWKFRGALCFCLLALSLQGQTGYRIIHVGGSMANLPFPCETDALFCEGKYDGQSVRVMADDGRILNIDVMYSSSPITLAQAIRLHSLQPGFAAPIFGLATDRDEKTYGIADTANDIVYFTSGVAAIDTVKMVSYLSPNAPVLATAARLTLGENESLLLHAARLAKPYSSSTAPVQPSGPADESAPKALNRKEAMDGVAERADKVIGSGRMVLALIGQVSTWYELDKDHPDATAKSQDLRTMNAKFESYWDDLIGYAEANKSLLRDQDLEVIPLDMKKEVDSKMRQLKAMGFEG